MNSIKNKLKTQWKLITVVAFVAFLLGLFLRPSNSSQNHEMSGEQTAATMWTCSMHPQIRQPEPGKCPICAMDLIPVQEDAGAQDLGERQLYLSPTAQKLADVQTNMVEKRNFKTTMSVFGKIAIDETRQKTISAWAPGRIEKLFVDYTGASVRQGDPLVEIYSPELFVAQQEYLNALGDNSSLFNIDNVKKKLALWGITSEQLDEIEQRGTATERMTIYSPLSGIVLSKSVNVGEYVKTGSSLYEIADLSHVWVYLDVYEQDMVWLKKGETVSFTASALPGQTFRGTIDFIEPVLNQNSRTVKVRAVADNPDNVLKPGILITATIDHSTGNKMLSVPASAVLLTGERAVVYVAVPDKEGVFEGREIIIGPRSGDYYSVKNGLDEGEFVVTNGAFKIDSEMQILAKKSMMSSDVSVMPNHNHAAQNISTNNSMNMTPHSHDSMAPKVEKNENVYDEKPTHSVDSASNAISKEFIASLDPLYLAYYEIQDQLAHDKPDQLESPAKQLTAALKNIDASGAGQHAAHWQHLSDVMQKAVTQIRSTPNISIIRAEFKKLSDAMIETATMFGASENLTVRQYHCPMAFNDTGADWLSPKDDVENPYFGAEMFSCGWRVKTFSEKGGDK